MEGQTDEKVPEQVGEPVTTDVEPQTPVEHNVAHDPSADVRIRRKLDLHMMPLFFVLCAYHGTPLPLLLMLITM
jgi:hypothetical protein